MSAASTAARQAMILAALAQHRAAHHLALVRVLDLTRTAEVRLLDGPGVITTCARHATLPPGQGS